MKVRKLCADGTGGGGSDGCRPRRTLGAPQTRAAGGRFANSLRRWSEGIISGARRSILGVLLRLLPQNKRYKCQTLLRPLSRTTLSPTFATVGTLCEAQESSEDGAMIMAKRQV